MNANIKGLATQEVKYLSQKYGKNEINVDPSSSLISKYVSHFREPMISLLLASAFISFMLKEYGDSISIFLAIFIVVTVGFIQEYKSDETLAAITRLLPPTCICNRDGHPTKILASDLVPGDIVLLYNGDRVPADINIIESHELRVDESSLTGESSPVSKVGSINHLLSDSNSLYMGTIIAHGNAKGIVVNIGTKTQLGKLYSMMTLEQAPKSPLKLQMEILSRQISMYSVLIIVLIVIVGLAQRRPILSMLTMGVSLAVAAIPEGLPIVMTVTLALGVIRMAKRNAIVKKMPVVESLGCVSAFCVDKTGTITTNNMSIVHIFTSSGQNIYFGLHSESFQYFEALAQINSLISNDHALEHLIKGCCLCNNAQIGYDNNLIGQPTECALLSLGLKSGYYHQTLSTKRLQEIPFSSTTKFMAVQIENPASSTKMFYVKGAVEIVLEKCKYFMQGNETLPLNERNLSEFSDSVGFATENGCRVLALAVGEDMNSLVFLGFVMLADPIRPNITQIISQLKLQGIICKILTGDSRETACSVGKSIGIGMECIHMISGAELETCRKEDLDSLVLQTDLFYRVNPLHKIEIIKRLRSLGHIVAMAGDGVNDSVALRAAHIGISMGRNASDACKEASDIVVTDDDLANIVFAINEGKIIFKNIQNFVCFQLSSSIAALALTSFFFLMGFKPPLNSTQILWINIIMDGPPAQSLGVEVATPTDRSRPRSIHEQIINSKIVLSIISSASIIFLGVSIVHFYELTSKEKENDTTMSFTCFVFSDLLNALNCRSMDESIFKLGICSNKFFVYSFMGSFFVQLLVIYTPFLSGIFNTRPLSITEITVVALLSSSVFFIVEILKNRANRTKKN